VGDSATSASTALRSRLWLYVSLVAESPRSPWNADCNVMSDVIDSLQYNEGTGLSSIIRPLPPESHDVTHQQLFSLEAVPSAAAGSSHN
jgi:hypothetical protein